MYVCDEANIETHGLKPMGRLAQDWGWENTFVSRVCRMVQRDFNHPSIIFWSLGNEAGRGRNFSLARELVLGLDETRPICYESGTIEIDPNERKWLTLFRLVPSLIFFVCCRLT
jgi:beta-galactosidase